MGSDNQPKHRQANKLARRKARRESFDRILIVTEGKKTEPNYFNEIKAFYRLPSANVSAIPSAYGTDPLSVVNYAEHLFIEGEESLSIPPRAFEKVYAVFDRDDHHTYHDALGKAASLNQKLQNDLRQLITFKAIASIPCFELWLLLHYEQITHPLHRNDTIRRLKGHLPDYQKGQGGLFKFTQPLIETANRHALELINNNTQHGDGPYTDIHTLVDLLVKLRV